MEFIDLKPQLNELRPQIEKRFSQIFDHGAFINGPEVTELETALETFCGAETAIACSNGSDAIVLALLAADVTPGDEVITTPFSFFATASMIHLLGAKPVFVDIEPNTWNMDASLIEKAITAKTKAILPVSLYGHVCDLKTINEIGAKHNLVVIEDAAQSFGGKGFGKMSCNLSSMATTSFYPAKPLGAYGEGGAVFSNDKKLGIKLKELRNHGMESNYFHTHVGINARLNSFQCAVVSEKLKTFSADLSNRQSIAERYLQGLEPLINKDIRLPYTRPDFQSSWAQFTISVPDRDDLRKVLSEQDIPTAVHYPTTIADQPIFKKAYSTESLNIPVARKEAQRVVSLPMYPTMPESDQKQVIEALLKHYK